MLGGELAVLSDFPGAVEGQIPLSKLSPFDIIESGEQPITAGADNAPNTLDTPAPGGAMVVVVIHIALLEDLTAAITVLDGLEFFVLRFGETSGLKNVPTLPVVLTVRCRIVRLTAKISTGRELAVDRERLFDGSEVREHLVVSFRDPLT